MKIIHEFVLWGNVGPYYFGWLANENINFSTQLHELKLTLENYENYQLIRFLNYFIIQKLFSLLKSHPR